MNEFITEAIEKLTHELDGTSGDKYGAVVKKPLFDTLCDFCKQDAEFAQAVVQGGSFGACLNAAVKGVSNHTPDVDIYRNAVRFYFPGADIRLSMSIDLIGNASTKTPKKSSGIMLNLSDFL
ncbi:MAG: hypothetical protein RR053_07115 [Evtepia sp.]